MSLRSYLEADLADIARMLGRATRHLEGRTILITGACGMLGRITVYALDHLNAHVLTKPIRIIAMDSAVWPPEDREELQGLAHVDFIHSDARMEIGVQTPIDYVLHMAGIASPTHYKKHPLLTLDVSVQGSRNTLELALRNKARYLFTSSSEVYGTPPPDMIPTPEHYVGQVPTMTPRSAYDVGKLAGETLAYIYHQQFGLHTTVVRFFNAFGVGLRETDHRILPRLASATKAERALEIYGEAGALPTRTYCPAANSVAGMLLALLVGHSGEVYNVGLDVPEIDVVTLAHTVERITGRIAKYTLAPPPTVYQTEPLRRCPDITKAREQLGYRPIVSLHDGLKRYFDWALATYQGILPE